MKARRKEEGARTEKKEPYREEKRKETNEQMYQSVQIARCASDV